MSVPYFEMENVVKELSDRPVLDGVNLKVESGESIVIMGQSGEGKSVILRHLLGLMKPDEGVVKVKGQAINELSDEELIPLRKKMGILFQDGALFDFLSVSENVAFPLAESGVKDSKKLKELARAALDKVGLAEHMDDSPLSLSGGMRKRVALARATIAGPDCILCDEPTSGLDPVAADDINKLIRDTVRESRATAVVVTHDITTMKTIADRIVFLKDGRIYFSGTPEDIKNSPDQLIQDFFEIT